MKIYFQNSINGAPSYTSDEFTDVLGMFLTDGVLIDGTAGLACTFATTSTKESVKIAISAGKACIGGSILYLDAQETLTIGSATGETKAYLVQVYKTSAGEMGIEAVDTDVPEAQTDTKTTTPLAVVVVNPKNSATPDKVIDKRLYVSNVLENLTTDSVLAPLQADYDALAKDYTGLAGQIESGAPVATLGMQTVTATACVTSFTVPDGVIKSLITSEVYLNGRLYSGNLVTVNTTTCTITVSETVTQPNTVKVVLFYPKASES